MGGKHQAVELPSMGGGTENFIPGFRLFTFNRIDNPFRYEKFASKIYFSIKKKTASLVEFVVLFTLLSVSLL